MQLGCLKNDEKQTIALSSCLFDNNNKASTPMKTISPTKILRCFTYLTPLTRLCMSCSVFVMCCAGSAESFSHLCLLQGILSHSDNQTLMAENQQINDLHNAGFRNCVEASCHTADDKYSSEWFLLQLLPAIKQLCVSAKFKYHAFRLLELWMNRLKSVCNNSSEEDFCLADKYLTLTEDGVLELLISHMDCCVDGVTEIIGCILDSVMQLDKLLNQHKSEHWLIGFNSLI